SFHQVRQLSIVGLSSGVSEAFLRFNCSLVLPHFNLHPCFPRRIFNPNCGECIWFINSKSAETKSFKWRCKCICFSSHYFQFYVHFVRLITIGKLKSGYQKSWQSSSLPSWPSRK
ncbi:hypothetical protein, partial [Aliivibrio fischeri]|uniref:hypothetical protein n=1 Tax=Aliivibrio fischeri TaxID=668 RepID=UPI001969F586